MHLNSLPVIAGFFPDPTVCRVGEDYYLANSSFEYFPGAPLHHSRDLVHWEHIGNIIDRPQQHRFGGGDSTGIYGSTLRHHDGRFWFITTNMNDFTGGQVIYSATDPAGPWSDGVRVPVIGIDPDLAWEEDGTCRLTLRTFVLGPEGPGEQFIGQAVIDPSTGEVCEPVKKIWQGSGSADTEGPHLYRIGEYWYLFAAEGGTTRGHMVTVARSAAVDGPFQLSPVHPLLTRRSTDHPVQSTGHGDLVQRGNGEWAMVHLGTRPRGFGYGYHTNGRETFVTGIAWTEDGWPTLDEFAFQPEATDHSFTEDFRRGLGVRWVAVDRPLDFAETAADGLSLRDPNGRAALLTRVRDPHWRAEADVEAITGVGGLEVYLASRARCEVSLESGEAVARAHLPGMTVELGRVAVPSSSLTLTVTSAAPPQEGRMPPVAPDILRFGVIVDDAERSLGELDGRYLSTEFEGRFTGRMVGVFVDSGALRARQFRYESR